MITEQHARTHAHTLLPTQWATQQRTTRHNLSRPSTRTRERISRRPDGSRRVTAPEKNVIKQETKQVKRFTAVSVFLFCFGCISTVRALQQVTSAVYELCCSDDRLRDDCFLDSFDLPRRKQHSPIQASKFKHRNSSIEIRKSPQITFLNR